MPGSEQYCSSDDLRAPLRLRLRSASTRPSNPFLSGLVPGAASAALLRPPAFRSRSASLSAGSGLICSAIIMAYGRYAPHPPAWLPGLFRRLCGARWGLVGSCMDMMASVRPLCPSPLRRGRMRLSGPTLPGRSLRACGPIAAHIKCLANYGPVLGGCGPIGPAWLRWPFYLLSLLFSLRLAPLSCSDPVRGWTGRRCPAICSDHGSGAAQVFAHPSPRLCPHWPLPCGSARAGCWVL